MKTLFFLFIAGVLTLNAQVVKSSILEDRETDFVKAVLPNSKIEKIEKSEATGWYRVYTGNNLLYVNPTERKIFFGKLYTMGGQDLTSDRLNEYNGETKLEKIRALNIINELLAVDPVVYGDNNGKYVAAVFTDPFCPVCQQSDSYLKKAGVTVYYHLFPLEQLHPQAPERCKQLYSAKDFKSAMEKPIGEKIGNITGTGEKKLKTSITLGEKIGVQGTPTIVVIDIKTKEIIAISNMKPFEVLEKYFGDKK